MAGLAELSGKRLELLRETLPSLARVAVLYHPTEAGQLIQVRTIQDAARTLRVALQLEATDTLDELYAGLDAVAKRGPDGLIDCHGASFYGRGFDRFGTLLDFAVKHRLPQIFGGAEAVRAGALMSLGASTEGRFRVVAHLVDKILKGANPGSLPIQVADTLDLALNLTMARKIGLTFPESVLRQATEIIQ